MRTQRGNSSSGRRQCTTQTVSGLLQALLFRGSHCLQQRPTTAGVSSGQESKNRQKPLYHSNAAIVRNGGGLGGCCPSKQTSQRVVTANVLLLLLLLVLVQITYCQTNPEDADPEPPKLVVCEADLLKVCGVCVWVAGEHAE